MDTLGNLLTTLVNGQRAGKERVAIPYSRNAQRVLTALKDRDRLASLRIQEGTPGKIIVTLKYESPSLGVIRGARRLSRPGARRYAAKSELPYPQHGKGFFIVSTSRGVMDEISARRAGLGGEIMCEVW